MDARNGAQEIKRAVEARREVGSTSNHAVRPPTLFVKVNMYGYLVGRKINILAHNNYESLSHTLKNLFRNFLVVDFNKSDEQVEKATKEYLVFYECKEGERLLGDVPWEEFITKVRRLYIAHGPHEMINCNYDDEEGSGSNDEAVWGGGI